MWEKRELRRRRGGHRKWDLSKTPSNSFEQLSLRPLWRKRAGIFFTTHDSRAHLVWVVFRTTTSPWISRPWNARKETGLQRKAIPYDVWSAWRLRCFLSCRPFFKCQHRSKSRLASTTSIALEVDISILLSAQLEQLLKTDYPHLPFRLRHRTCKLRWTRLRRSLSRSSVVGGTLLTLLR